MRKPRGKPANKDGRNKGFDVSALAWEPTTDDEREQFRQQEPWYTFFPPLSDAEALTILEEILALRRQRLRSKDAGEPEERRVLELIARLAHGVAGWAAVQHLQLSHAAGFLMKSTTDPTLTRMVAMGSLQQPLALMPAKTQKLLAEALDKLSDGIVLPILERRRGGPRGKEWRRRQAIELDLLCWIKWQVAKRGLGVIQAQTAVARACRLSSPDAVRNWKNRLAERLGSLDEVLEVPRRIGELEAAGKDPLRDPTLATEAKRLRAMNIQDLGEQYTRASESRVKPGRKSLKRSKT